ncbi:hypothetical protein [Umezawaea sp.]|uniref:hypothetical protein n=1 Tax=Umezawaea sp. TaxID=1955258 RepID=UPI002ED6B44B
MSERREFLEGGLRPVECLACGNRVLVKKHSLRHTSVQWTSDAALSCPEFAAAGRDTALIATCLALRDSIERAVRDGVLEVADG